MSEIRFVELCCQRCGGELEEKGGAFVCKCCGKKWLNEKSNDFNDMLNACEEANRRQRVEDIANLRQLLWKEISKEYVSNKEVERLCKEIQKYLPKDFYANFFLATCAKDKAALGDFLYNTDVDEHFDDIPLILDYLLKSLKKPEWAIGVSDFIEKIKDIDMELFHTYRTRFEEEYKKIDDNVFEADLERDVFVAYSSKDMLKVNELVNALEAEGLSCFVAARNMRHGSGSVEDYSELLHTAINHCQVFVFVSSKNSRTLDCDAWREEINYIIDHRKDMPRVEFVIQNYCGRSAERNFKKFFSGLEYCTSAKDVVDRVTDILMHGWKVPKTQTGEEPQVETIETTVETHVNTPEQEQPDTQPIKEKQIKEKQKKTKTKKQPKTIPVFNDKRDEIYKKGIKLKHSKSLGALCSALYFWIWTGAVGFITEYDIYFGGVFNSWRIDIIVFAIISIVYFTVYIVIFNILNNYKVACNFYNKGLKFFKKNDDENAVKFYRKAAEQGFAKAQNVLGDCYYEGKGGGNKKLFNRQKVVSVSRRTWLRSSAI